LVGRNEQDDKNDLSSGRKSRRAKSSVLRVLLVDDHEPNRTTLARLLANRLHKVTVAGSVAEAVALGNASEFDLVISDIGLPDGTGHEAFKAIRRRSPEAKGVALTGYGMDQGLIRSKDSGFSTHLTKPVRIDALDSVLANISKFRSGS
jgi:CheY-like chemotaxis protein